MTTSPTDVVILGGTGFIGQRLTERLRDEGDAVPTNACRRITSWSSKDCNLLDLDASRRQLAMVSESTVLVVCSGISRLAGDSWSLFQTNVTMIRNLVESIAHVRPRGIVFLSSTDVYGLPAAELPITETTLPRPTTYYGLSKLACEGMLRLPRPNAGPLTCLRLPGIYGPTDGGRSVVGRFCHRLAARQSIQLSGDASVLRSFVHVDDLCAVIAAAITAPLDVTLNVAFGQSTPIGILAAAVAEQLDLPAATYAELVESIPVNPERDHHLVFDPRRLGECFPGITLRGPLPGIKDYLTHLQQAR